MNILLSLLTTLFLAGHKAASTYRHLLTRIKSLVIVPQFI